MAEAAPAPRLYHFHARGGGARRTVEGWRPFQGENRLKLSFVHGYGSELVRGGGPEGSRRELVLGEARPWVVAAAGAADRATASKLLQRQQATFSNSAFSQEPLKASTCGQIGSAGRQC